MIAAAVIAAGILAPAGVTAGIQADPVCLPVTAQSGHSYPLTVSVSGSSWESLTLAVTPSSGTLSRRLHQVPASWVSFAANPVTVGSAGTAEVALTLTVPDGAAPGAYWSDVEAGTSGQAQPGSGAQAVLGAAAATTIVFTIGPSQTPPPPCDALDLAQSTGKFPAWPSKAFATSSWKQVFARERASEPRPYLSPTASPAPDTRSMQPSAAESVPASTAAASSSDIAPSMVGWALLWGIVLLFVILRFRRRS